MRLYRSTRSTDIYMYCMCIIIGYRIFMYMIFLNLSPYKLSQSMRTVPSTLKALILIQLSVCLALRKEKTPMPRLYTVSCAGEQTEKQKQVLTIVSRKIIIMPRGAEWRKFQLHSTFQ